MGRSGIQKRSLGVTTRRRGRRSHTSYHNEVTAKTHGGVGYCTMHHEWKVCDWPECEDHGKEKKGICGFIHGYKPEANNENGDDVNDKNI